MKGWSKEALDAYKLSGDEMIAKVSAKPMREIHDKDCNSVLTFWATPKGLVITQVFKDTGDVLYMKNVPSVDECC